MGAVTRHAKSAVTVGCFFGPPWTPILYVNRTGIAWEYLPHDFPQYKTVHGYFALWEKEGCATRRCCVRTEARDRRRSAVVAVG